MDSVRVCGFATAAELAVARARVDLAKLALDRTRIAAPFAATLLADGPVELGNIPRIRDVEAMLGLIADLGATVEWTGPNTVRVDARGAQSRPLDPELCARIRASITARAPAK